MSLLQMSENHRLETEAVGGAAVRNFLHGEGYQANSEEREYFRGVLLIILASIRWKGNRSMPAKAPPQAEMLFPPVISIITDHISGCTVKCP